MIYNDNKELVDMVFKSELISKCCVKSFNNKLTGEIEYTYKYRDYEYTIYANTNKGNEPLSWQHSNAQGRIDLSIEMAEQEAPEQEDKNKMTANDCLSNLFNV